MDRYRLIEPLGTGGMSVVWRAFDEILERPVAVKLLAPKLLDDPESRRRIQAEARAAALLSHPHIAQVYDFGHRSDGAPYVVMELVTGRSLDDAGPLSPEAILRAGAELAGALAAVHARGLVHRDVKPANVMLTDGGAKLVDFGISAVAGDHSDKTGQIMGTPAYLAPERIRGLPTTAATDIYALGLLLYRALAGRFPWPDGTTTTGVIEAHRRTRPEPLPAGRVSRDVAAAIARCLAKAPENRPSAAEMAHLLSTASSRSSSFSPSSSFSLFSSSSSPASSSSSLSSFSALPSAVFASTRRVVLSPNVRALLSRNARVLRSRDARGKVAAVGVAAVAVVGVFAMSSSGSAAADAQAKKPAWMSGSAPAPSPVDCTVEYSVRSENAGAFNADLDLKAAGGASGGWSLTFRVPDGQAIGAIDGATWHQDGTTVLLGGPDFAADLAAGAHFAVAGAYRDASTLPADFTLNGAACRSVLLAPAAVTVVTQAPTAQKTAPPAAKPPVVKAPGKGPGPGRGPEKKGKEDDD
ncbi:serine/threonine-protein kinase [Dactylosporangium sp. CS-033363]|uniref:serine/threonine-protein kinase n=1 Tax=Dactylosporangium sp. CS-033363 TaxID=3239935 RepID=UPI003D8EFAC2